jgi:hypothetical protein
MRCCCCDYHESLNGHHTMESDSWLKEVKAKREIKYRIENRE